MSQFVNPTQEITNSIVNAINIIRRLRLNYIQYPVSFIPEESSYNNWKQATRIHWLGQIKNILIEELQMVLKLDDLSSFSKAEKISLQAKCLRRIHELLSKIILMTEINDDESYISIVLENLYTLGRGYKNAPLNTPNEFKKQYTEELKMSKVLFDKFNIPKIDISESEKYKKFGKIEIQEKIPMLERYKPLNKKDGLPISKIKVYNQKDMLYKYMLLSEYSHAKPYYSYVVKGLSERLSLLFAHELCLLSLEFLALLYLNQRKEIEEWVNEFLNISKSYSQYSRIANSLDK